MRRVLIWLALVLYPLYTAGLYLAFLREPYVRIETKQMELKMIREKRLLYLRARLVEDEIAKQRERMRDLLGRFSAKAKGIDRAGVPVFIGQVAGNANVSMTEITVRGESALEGCVFLATDIRMRGGFVELFRFLQGLEDAEGRFVFLDQLQIAPGRAGEAHELTARVNVLLRTPGAGPGREAQRGLPKETGKAPATAVSPAAAPHRASGG